MVCVRQLRRCGRSRRATPYDDDVWFRLWAGQHSCEDFSCVTLEDAP